MSENNKAKVGETIFPFVRIVVGSERSPKITGLMMELDLPRVKAYLSRFGTFLTVVQEFDNEVEKSKKPQDQPTSSKTDRKPEHVAKKTGQQSDKNGPAYKNAETKLGKKDSQSEGVSKKNEEKQSSDQNSGSKPISKKSPE